MDLIVSHTNADFDALASMVAASLLYPNALMALPGGADRNVREFLALHGDAVPLVPAQDIPLDRVRRLIVVETQHARRLGRFAELIGRSEVETVLYDHHAPHEPSITAQRRFLASCGANTTLMLDHLRQRNVAIDPVHATLFALGIYEDTGSLTFSTTTPEDVDAVAWLLRRGASLDMVATFVNRALSEAERRILDRLLATAEVHRVHGIQVLIATADAGGYVDELALLAHKLRDLESSDAVMVLVQLERTVLFVARSSVDAVSAAALARHFGGGGHERAASATVHHRTLDQVKAELLALLEQVVRPRVTAATLMSYPVRTVTPDTSIADAARLLLRFGHNGLTVVDDGRVVGIIARRDIDRAQHHGLGHAPVRGYLSGRVVPIAPDTPLPEIERLMIEHDVGRLPVLRDGALVGIVTRTDVLRAIHGERYPAPHTLYRGAGQPRNLWALYTERMPSATRARLARIGEIATGMGLTIFLVGGPVRDLLLGGPSLDIDILVEGEGIPLAEAVGQALGGEVVTHPKFHTGKVLLPEGAIDFATARTEYYQYPAALPTTEHSSVREDLYRRDFTINAMAMQLNGDDPGRLLDPFGGSRDLDEGAIRVLHHLSFVEDPTRIMRAARFEARYGFHMDERTEELARHAVQMALIDRLSGERVREELRQLFARPHAEPALCRLHALGVLAALESSWTLPEPLPEYHRIEDVLAWAGGAPAIAAHLGDSGHLRLLLIFARLDAVAAMRLARRLRLPKKEEALARRIPGLPAIIARLSVPDIAPSVVDELLHPLPIPLCLLLMALTEDAAALRSARAYLTRWHALPALVTGNDLKALGVPRGPGYARIMRALRAAQLDGNITTREDALALARQLADVG